MLTVMIYAVISLAVYGLIIYAVVLLVKALLKYLGSGNPTNEEQKVRQTLGQVIKSHRTRSGMTQEALAESLGVSRQAVSKWEIGASDPSTANLIALAKLFDMSVDELLEEAG